MHTRDDYRALIDAVSDIDAARLAAFIDGEGSIGIIQRNKLVGRMRSPNLSLSLIISNTNPILINWLKSTFDGSVYHVKYENCKHLGRKPTMRWQVNERMAGIILTRCLPWMLIKKAQAEVALAFMQLKKKQRGGTLRIAQLTSEDISQRVEMKMAIQRLNKEIPSQVIH